MKKLTISFALSLLLSVFTIAWAGNTPNNQTTQFLFVQTAHQAVIKAVPNEKNTYKLTLHKPRPFVTYFSDRPQRIVGLMPMDKFLNYWKTGTNSFSQNAPNTSLVGYDRAKPRGHEMVQLVVELDSPVYNAKHDTVTYTIHNLDTKTQPLPDFSKYSQIALFVDNACMSCGI